MKKIIYSICALVAASALLACRNDGDMITVADPNAGENLVGIVALSQLTESSSSDKALTLSWKLGAPPAVSNPSLSAPAVSNVLQFSADETFGTTYDVKIDNVEVSRSYTSGQLAVIMARLGCTEPSSYRLHARIKSLLSLNTEPVYSDVWSHGFDIAYKVDMRVVRMLDRQRENTLATLRSYQNTDSDFTLFEGFVVTPSSWLNVFFSEVDGTVWGNSGGGPFTLSNDSGFWNCWFPEPSGCYYVYFDLAARVWTPIHIASINVTADGVAADMKLYASSNRWMGLVTTTVDNAPIQIGGIAAKYDNSTGDGSSKDYAYTLTGSVDGTLQFVQGSHPSDISVAGAAGLYTVKINMTYMTYSVEEGDTRNSINDPDYAQPAGENVYLKDRNLATESGKLKLTSNGVYAGFVYSRGEEFFFSDGTTVYGCHEDDASMLYCGKDKTTARLNEGYYRVAADFTQHSWSATAVTGIVVVGDFNSWSTDADPMSYDASEGCWSAVVEPSSWGSYGIKFMINGDWNWCYTDTAGDGSLTEAITEFMPSVAAGGGAKYLIRIFLNDADAIRYTITEY